jgi:DNA-binding NarL/FixJ family response regulator
MPPDSVQSASTEPSSNGEPPDEDASAGRTGVYVVDDHPPIRRAVTNALESTIDLEVCGHASGLHEAAEQLREHAPDVIVVDLSLPNGHGLELVDWVQARDIRSAVLVLSMHDEAVYAERALRAGASGYLMKTEPLDRLVRAVRRAERGETCLSRQMASRILDGGRGGSEPCFPIDELTGRERQVFELLGAGRSVEEIQEQLDLSRKTVETYRRRAKEKLGCESIPALLQYAVQWTYDPESDLPVEA